MRFTFLAAFALCAPLPAAALNCLEPVTQTEMNQCAAQAYRAADGDLNLAYKMAVAQARAMDAYLGSDQKPAEDMLRDAQRAWIPFRDNACAAESTLARGGSMQPLLLHNCLERLTRQRTEDLRYFGEAN